MKRIIFLTTLGLMGLTVPAWGGGPCCTGHGVHCMTPEPYCPDCSEPCCNGHRCGLSLGAEHTRKLLQELHSNCCRDRIHAARKLGHRLHGDFCACPELLPALIHALQCDTCWEVRQAAAWAIAYQGARTKLGVLALYLASKLDPHYMVRDAAGDALDVLIVCRRECYKDLFAAADALAAKLKPMYQPTKGSCVDLYEQCCALAGSPAVAVVPDQAATPVVIQESPAHPMPSQRVEVSK